MRHSVYLYYIIYIISRHSVSASLQLALDSHLSMLYNVSPHQTHPLARDEHLIVAPADGECLVTVDRVCTVGADKVEG